MRERRAHLGLLPRAVHAAWGWRLEGALLAGAVVALRCWAAAGPGGDMLLTGVVGVALWRLPSLRRRLSEHLAHAAARRRLDRALLLAGVLGPFGGFAAVGTVAATPAGTKLAVRVPARRHVGCLEEAAPAIAAALRVREVRVAAHPGHASVATLEVVRRDPFAGPPLAWPWAGAEATSLWQRVPLGIEESGRSVGVGLPEHNLLLGGEPGAGKSAVLSLLVASAALDTSVSLTLLDATMSCVLPVR